MIRLFASCCEVTLLNTLTLNHCAALRALLDNGISFGLPESSTLPKATLDALNDYKPGAAPNWDLFLKSQTR